MKPKQHFLFLFLLLFTTTCFAFNRETDTLKTDRGLLLIHPIYHASLALQWNGLTIYIDPYHGAEGFKGLPKPDLILITDIHRDHFDFSTLQGIDLSQATIVCPTQVSMQMPKDWIEQVHEISNGESWTTKKIQIEAIAMYNLPEEANSMHTKGRGNGYLLTIGGKRIYISGDTEDTPEMRNLKEIDLAFVCMNLPYTMSVEQAVAGVLAFEPKIVYPYHYKGIDGYSHIGRFKELINDSNQQIEVRLCDWYAGEQQKK
ncbi:MAG: MBL fold metallo-hydrolase [Crocinitomicaceae bacterium]|jgi:L-ascorbate metabolism protein UlaG (beta-lactamase superfamily)|nr:MBL fold metallo-hydrolase [Crocinitomicaceae bacterium]